MGSYNSSTFTAQHGGLMLSMKTKSGLVRVEIQKQVLPPHAALPLLEKDPSWGDLLWSRAR